VRHLAVAHPLANPSQPLQAVRGPSQVCAQGQPGLNQRDRGGGAVSPPGGPPEEIFSGRRRRRSEFIRKILGGGVRCFIEAALEYSDGQSELYPYTASRELSQARLRSSASKLRII